MLLGLEGRPGRRPLSSTTRHRMRSSPNWTRAASRSRVVRKRRRAASAGHRRRTTAMVNSKN